MRLSVALPDKAVDSAGEALGQGPTCSPPMRAVSSFIAQGAGEPAPGTPARCSASRQGGRHHVVRQSCHQPERGRPAQ